MWVVWARVCVDNLRAKPHLAPWVRKVSTVPTAQHPAATCPYTALYRPRIADSPWCKVYACARGHGNRVLARIHTSRVHYSAHPCGRICAEAGMGGNRSISCTGGNIDGSWATNTRLANTRPQTGLTPSHAGTSHGMAACLATRMTGTCNRSSRRSISNMSLLQWPLLRWSFCEYDTAIQHPQAELTTAQRRPSHSPHARSKAMASLPRS